MTTFATAALMLLLQAGCDAGVQRWPWTRAEVPITLPETTGEYAPPADAFAADATTGSGPDVIVPVAVGEAPAGEEAAPTVAGGATSPAPGAQADPNAPARAVGGRQVVAASVLQVNGRFFTIDDVVKAAGPRMTALPRTLAPQELNRRAIEIISDTVTQLVWQELLLEQANRKLNEQQTEAIDTEVEKDVAEMIAASGGSRTSLQLKLEAQGTSLEAVIRDMRDNRKVQAYMHTRFADELSISRRDMWEYYRQHPEEFTTAKQVRMQMIAVPARAFLPAQRLATDAEIAEAREKARKQIDAAAAEIAAGKDFAGVARAYSRGPKAAEGGVWPLLPADTFRITEVEQAAFALEQGQVSDIIEAGDGFYLVKAMKVEPMRVEQFESAQAGIEDRLREARYVALSEKHLKDLYDKADISKADEFAEITANKAIAEYCRP